MKVRGSLEANLKAASEGVQEAGRQEPAFIALPEYFSVPNSMEQFTSASKISKETYQSTINFLSAVSREFSKSYISGGTVLEEHCGEFFNTSTLWKNGVLIAKYRKKNPISVEMKAGVSGGSEPVVVKTECCKVGLLVCADMFDPVIVKQTVDLGAELIFLPVAAMGTHPRVTGHPLTERISSENGVFLVKIGNVGSSLRGGRSAIIAPWGVLEEVSDVPEDSLVTMDLDLKRLRQYRRKLSKT